jgi:hypothetical protein
VSGDRSAGATAAGAWTEADLARLRAELEEGQAVKRRVEAARQEVARQVELLGEKIELIRAWGPGGGSGEGGGGGVDSAAAGWAESAATAVRVVDGHSSPKVIIANACLV